MKKQKIGPSSSQLNQVKKSIGRLIAVANQIHPMKFNPHPLSPAHGLYSVKSEVLLNNGNPIGFAKDSERFLAEELSTTKECSDMLAAKLWRAYEVMHEDGALHSVTLELEILDLLRQAGYVS